jgi:hypothetical protein
MNKTTKLSEATSFIAGQPYDLPASEVVKLAQKAGVKQVNAQRVYVVRQWMRKRDGAASKRASRSRAPARARDDDKLASLRKLIIAHGTENVRKALAAVEASAGQLR